MIKLTEYRSLLEKFIGDGIGKFRAEAGFPVRSIGVYCCPWSGWVSLNFDKKPCDIEWGENCPDYDFAEYDLIDFPQWSTEYNERDIVDIQQVNGDVVSVSEDDGDEAFNEVFFSFLESFVSDMVQERTLHEDAEVIDLQMLDSELVRTWTT